MNFQDMIHVLTKYWGDRGCLALFPYDMEKGAGTSNPHTFLRALGPEPWNCVFVEPSRRPTDGRYGENPNRLQHYFQMQVIMKPSPPDIQDLYLGSLRAIGIDPARHDMRFVEDDWENPTLGAWGVGWEVWMDGMEITQFTYFQQVGGFETVPTPVEITYGLERLAMYIQGVSSVFDVEWAHDVKYREVYHDNEVQQSTFNFEKSNAERLFKLFALYEEEAREQIGNALPNAAYDFVLKSSHCFNLLDARGAISVTERARYIGRIRDLAREVARIHLERRQALGFPLLVKDSVSEPPLPPVGSRQASADGAGRGEGAKSRG